MKTNKSISIGVSVDVILQFYKNTIGLGTVRTWSLSELVKWQTADSDVQGSISWLDSKYCFHRRVLCQGLWRPMVCTTNWVKG